jgi:hypothetical protein
MRYLRLRAVDAVALETPEELGRDDVVEARPAERLERLPHDHLALPLGVHLGVVEEVDAGVHRLREHLAGRRGVDLVVIRDPRAEREDAQLQAARAEAAVVHDDPLFLATCRDFSRRSWRA